MSPRLQYGLSCSPRVLGLLAGLALGAGAGAALGQSGGAAGGGTRAPQPTLGNPVDRGAWLSATIGVDFPGGTLAEYVAAIRAGAGDWAVNVAFTDGADRLTMPAVTFRNVQLETAVRAMAQLATARGGRVRVTDAGANPQSPFPTGTSGAPMFVVGVDRPRDADANEVFSRVLSIASLTAPRGDQTAGMSPDVILSAIDAGLQSDPGSPPSIRFHKDSGLLFVSGTKQQVELAMEVLSRLESDAKARQRGSGKPVTETFNLAHAPATAVVDVLRTVFPQGPDQPAKVTVTPNAQTNSAVVSAPEDQMPAVRALLRYFDSDPRKMPAVLEAMAEREAAARQLDVTAAEYQRARDMLAKTENQTQLLRAEAETARVRAEEMGKLLDVSRQQAMVAQADFAKVRQAHEAATKAAEDRSRQLESELVQARRVIDDLKQRLDQAKPK